MANVKLELSIDFQKPARNEIYKQLIAMNGKKYQLRIYLTELYELMTEVMKITIDDSKKDTIYQEIADLLICTEQFYIYALDNDDLEESIFEPFVSNIFNLDLPHITEDLFALTYNINDSFAAIVMFLIDYQNLIIVDENGKLPKWFDENCLQFSITYRSFIIGIRKLLIIKNNYSPRATQLAFNYKIARLSDRVNNKRHL